MTPEDDLKASQQLLAAVTAIREELDHYRIWLAIQLPGHTGSFGRLGFQCSQVAEATAVLLDDIAADMRLNPDLPGPAWDAAHALAQAINGSGHDPCR